MGKLFIKSTKAEGKTYIVTVESDSKIVGSFETTDEKIIEDIGCYSLPEVFNESDLVKFKSFQELEAHCMSKASE